MSSISEFRSKRTSRQKKKQAERQSHFSLSLSIRMTMFWNERADRLLLPFLDKSDMMKLSALSHTWQGIVNSRYLFSTILSSIKEVVKENSLQATPDIPKKKSMQFTSSRQLPPRNYKSKFSKRFNMNGSGITPVSKSASGLSDQASLSGQSTQISSLKDSQDTFPG